MVSSQALEIIAELEEQLRSLEKTVEGCLWLISSLQTLNRKKLASKYIIPEVLDPNCLSAEDEPL